jgi:hypothetical protein
MFRCHKSQYQILPTPSKTALIGCQCYTQRNNVKESLLASSCGNLRIVAGASVEFVVSKTPCSVPKGSIVLRFIL